jgi:hypothetical protein
VLYVFYRRDQGKYVLFPYNLIRKEMQNPIQCNGYSLFPDGKLVVFRVQGEEPTRLHPMQVWRTPFMSAEFAAAAPTDGSYLSKVGNAELVRGISEALSVVRLVENQDPRRETYEDLIAQATRVADNYYWIGQAEAGDLGSALKAIKQTGELIIDEFEKVVAIRKRAREALAEAQAKQTALIKTLRPGDWKSVEQYMHALTALRNQRGAVITLREVRSIDLAALDVLEKQLVEEFDRISKACVDFLVKGDALKPVTGSLDGVLAKLDKVDNAAQLVPLEQEITALGDGLNVLAEVVSGLQVGDAVARTKILEDISTVFAHHGRVRATYQSVRKQLLTREGKAEFAAQFKLFSQTVSSALAQADTPEKCDEQLAKLLVQLEELSGRFSEFDEFLGDLTAKREEVHDALAARKQTLLDERQARVQTLVVAAERILEGVARRAQTFKAAEELNAYFAADAMVLKAKELVEKLMGLGASVKADEISSKIISSRQDALRTLRDRLELFEDGARSSSSGRSASRQHAGARRDAAGARRPDGDPPRRHGLLRDDRRSGVQQDEGVLEPADRVGDRVGVPRGVPGGVGAGRGGGGRAGAGPGAAVRGGARERRAHRSGPQVRGGALRRGVRARPARRGRGGDPREAAGAARDGGAAARVGDAAGAGVPVLGVLRPAGAAAGVAPAGPERGPAARGVPLHVGGGRAGERAGAGDRRVPGGAGDRGVHARATTSGPGRTWSRSWPTRSRAS